MAKLMLALFVAAGITLLVATVAACRAVSQAAAAAKKARE